MISFYHISTRRPALARASIGRFIDDIYNGQRLHSALNYLSPMEFEGRAPGGGVKDAGVNDRQWDIAEIAKTVEDAEAKPDK